MVVDLKKKRGGGVEQSDMLSLPFANRPALALVNIQRCRWVWAKLEKPSTVDCTPWPAFYHLASPGRGETPAWTGGAGTTATEKVVFGTADKQKYLHLSNPQQRSQSTFIAVGGFNCMEELTERWMQLCPRFHRNVKQKSVPLCWWCHYLFPCPRPPACGCGEDWRAAQIASWSRWRRGGRVGSLAAAAEEEEMEVIVGGKWPLKKCMQRVCACCSQSMINDLVIV